jgi:antitoxin component YwqK of YwqJK toxin-antitoxin module
MSPYLARSRRPERDLSATGPETLEPAPHIEQYANGVVKITGSYLDGEMHGAWTWNRVDGSVMRTGAFDRGRQVGVWRTFDRAGRLVKETDFGTGG